MGRALDGRVAVVTGSGRGIGRAIALLMADEGAKVVVNDRGVASDGSGGSGEPADDVVREIVSRGGIAVANYDTVATIEGGRQIVQAALDSFGRIDILVNNAGVFWMKPFLELTEHEWDSMLEVHLKGHFACTKAAVPHMMQQKHGRIINLSSGAALGPVGASAVHYATAKGGVLAFTRSLACALGEHGITVNAVMPVAKTRMHDTITPGAPIPANLALTQTPEDVAPLVGYLATDQASDINGATFAARTEGTIQLLSNPVPTNGIYKDQRWTVAELAAVIPKTLAQGLINPAPAKKQV